MKKLILTMMLVLATLNTVAQKFDVSLQVNSGVSYYRGPGTESKTFINEGFTSGTGYTNNPYGNIQGAAYGASADAKFIIKRHILLGMQVGYDQLHYKINLFEADHTTAPPYHGGASTGVIGGQTIFTATFYNVDPYVGLRINIKQVAVDLTFGPEIAKNLSYREKGSTTATDGQTVTTDADRGKGGTTVRNNYNIKIWFHRFGISAAYAQGLMDHTAGALYSTYGITNPPAHNVYDDVIRVGLTYKIY